ncbi:MAG: PHP domain-containing protein [Ignavibacteria bacterium]
MFEYSGVIHVHSTFSDGTGTVPDIMRYANEADLDYVILTDHNTLLAKDKGFEKFFGNTMLIVGYEVNDIDNKNHYLVVGLDELVGTYRVLPNGELGNNLPSGEYARLVREKGGAGFIAHPFEKRNLFPEHPAYPWLNWECEEYDGIEIWNHMSEWIEGLNEKNKIQRFLHPLKSITAPNPEAVSKWDEVNVNRKVVAIGSIDAHAHKQTFMGFPVFEVFPYKVLFRSIRTNVLLDEKIVKGAETQFSHYKKLIIDALRQGRSYITNYYYGDARGFRFFAEYADKLYNIGDEIIIPDNLRKRIVFNIFLPKSAHIILRRNGEVYAEFDGVGNVIDVKEEGNYRVECWIGDKAWIFSNHIRVRKSYE